MNTRETEIIMTGYTRHNACISMKNEIAPYWGFFKGGNRTMKERTLNRITRGETR